MNRKEKLNRKLSVLNPHYIEITNESYLHHDHMHSPSTGESHFALKISSDKLKNITRIEQHRIINNLLKEEFEQGLHAISIKVINI